MEATVVGAVIGATLQVVLQQLLSLPRDQIKDFKKDLEKLKTSFDYVHDILHDANMQNVTDRAVIRWMRNLEALAFEADNVLDEINYQLLSKKVKKISLSRAKNKVLSLFSHSKNLLGGRIREINEKLELNNQQATTFGLQARHACARAPAFGSHASASIETDSFSFDPIFIGRENDVLSIVDKLVTARPEERVLSVLPIVGMGGLGKSTLARKVFNDQKIISHFGENRVWVHAPRNFDVVVLLKNILTSMAAENVEYGNREALLKKLKNTLGRERYLLVLDDVWNEERDKWDDFVNSLSGVSSAVGNCVVVTTRSHDVALIVSTVGVHKLGGLSADDCWSIIKAKTSSNATDQYEEMGRNIAKRCQGLPLAAKVVGGLLCNKSRDEWISFEKDWFSNFGDENPISKILKLSFDNLSLPLLKKCFAYCSIFPKGFEIKKEQLIQLWMAEGFLLQTDQNNNMESIGSKFFSILLQSSLLQQVAKKDAYGNVACCNMHDLVHDLARSILCENFQQRYIGYSPNGDIESRSIPKEEARYVRTLFFNGNVYDINFSNFKSLRTLVLLGEEIDNLPTSISELIHLRYLDTSKTMIRSFPDTIGELYHLETLRAEKFRVCLKRVPDSFKYLINLRHLHIGDGIRLPPEIGRLTSLQTLEYFHVGEEKGYRISELGSLKNLKGKLVIHNLRKVRDKNEALSANLYQKKGILKLKLEGADTEGDEAKHESVLEGLQPHPNLKRLDISGFNGRRFPAWTLKMEVQDGQALNNLMEINLTRCLQVEELPMLGHLPHLKSLCLYYLENVRSIGSLFYNIDNCSRNSRNGDTTTEVFPTLKTLKLFDMLSLSEWAEVELPPAASEADKNQLVVFPRLEHLMLRECRKLTSAPSHFPCLKELIIDGIDSGLPLENICGAKLSSLTRLEISGIKDLECLPDGLFSNNHNMLKLSISKCMNLKSITTEGHEGGFISLRDLRIDSCEGLTRFPIEMIESCAPSLERLSLCALTDIQVGCLSKMPRLISLIITEAPRFNTEEICSVGSLEWLRMSPCSSWDDIVSFNLAVDAILQSSIVSLRRLELNGMSYWECLPDQIQHLTSLLDLYLSDYGMEALPEWFGNLSSLQGIYLSNFKKLRHMPSKEAMQRLTKLYTLQIYGSPPLLLKRKVNEEEEDPKIVDSEWHKISHIPSIYYNGRQLKLLKLIGKPIQIGPLDSLYYINMSPCSSSWDDNVSFNLAVDAILQASRVSLRSVVLNGMSDWECLPDQIQHLTSLDFLWLTDFGMEALPE